MPSSARVMSGRCGKFFSWGSGIRDWGLKVQDREERIERVVAVVSTLLVLLVFLLTGGLGLLEGVVGYAVAGAIVWVFAQRTFRPN